MAIFVVNRVPGDRENFLDYQKWPIFLSMGFQFHDMRPNMPTLRNHNFTPRRAF